MKDLSFFSIVTSVNLWDQEKVNEFLRCIESVKKQTYKNFEWIIVDDGSSQQILWEEVLVGIPKVEVIKKPHEERVIGYETGFKKAKGDWICVLDSDDEYIPNYLETLEKSITENPEYKMFNFGAIYKWKDEKETKREPFEPKILEVGHEVFGGGNIVWGTFIFHRSVYEDLGGFPILVEKVDCFEINYGGIRDLYMNSPYNLSAYYQVKYPEIRKYFMVDFQGEPNKIIKELGNPWGQDWALWYQYTRKYHSKPIKEYLYVVYPKP